MRRAFLHFLLMTAIILGAAAPGPGYARDLGKTFRLAEVAVETPEDAFIDWNAPDDPNYPLERDFIAWIFGAGAREAGAASLTGDRPARLHITVRRFDILSTLELFFCCAVNEIEADFTLFDAETGEVLLAPRRLEFNHVGRGGIFAGAADGRGDDQLSRIIAIVAERTSEWFAAGPA